MGVIKKRSVSSGPGFTTTALCVVAVLGLNSACSFVSRQSPKEAAQGREAFHAVGVPLSEVEVHATALTRLPGLVIVGSMSDLPGTSGPIGKALEVFDLRIGPAQQMHVRASVTETHLLSAKCTFSPEAMSVLNETLEDLYRENPMAAFPADVQVTFVPDGIELKRTQYAWRFGKTAVLGYWFSCDSAHTDESLLAAYLLLTHELTHAVVS